MSDTFCTTKRSEIMASVRGKNTGPEILIRKLLFARGLRFRVNVKTLPGTPDIVFPKYQTVIFVHGCFWHRHTNCNAATTPKTNEQYWIEKFQRNKIRDKQNLRELKNLGWHVIVLWECEIKRIRFDDKEQMKLLSTILQNITQLNSFSHPSSVFPPS